MEWPDFSNIPHNDLTAWIFWILIALFIVVGVDLVFHSLIYREMMEFEEAVERD